MKWSSVETTLGTYNYTNGDAEVDRGGLRTT